MEFSNWLILSFNTLIAIVISIIGMKMTKKNMSKNEYRKQ